MCVIVFLSVYGLHAKAQCGVLDPLVVVVLSKLSWHGRK